MNQFYFEDLSVGQSESIETTVTAEMIEQFADVTGDTNPLHLDPDYAAATRFGERIAHGALSAGFVSAVLGTRLPGIGAVYLSQSVRFLAPVKIGDTVKATATVNELRAAKNRVLLSTVCLVEGMEVLTGEAEIYVPARQ